MNDKISAKPASITSSTTLTLSSTAANKLISRYVEPPTGDSIIFNFNVSDASLMTLTTLLIQMMQLVYIDQVCKLNNDLSLGSYSPSNPNLYIETTAIQNGNITTSNNINACTNIYVTDGLIKGMNLDITSTSTVTGAITAQTINWSSITYKDSSGLDKLTIEGGMAL